MRCKPGDLAIIVSNGNPANEEHVGKFVTVVSECVAMSVLPVSWFCEPQLYASNGLPCVWHDGDLLPIRPPEEPVMVGQLEGLKERV